MKRAAALASLAATLLGAAPVHAAGGHHFVDDAALADTGTCDLETWHSRGGADYRWLHAGTACRVGAIELGANLDRGGRGERETSGGLQAKWARELGPQWAIGMTVVATWQRQAPRYAGTSVIIPLTWQATEQLTLHANVGRNLLHHEPSQPIWGIAADWAATAHTSLMAEHFSDGELRHHRLGLRQAITPRLSVDVSRTLPRSQPGYWTVGLNWNIDR